MFLPTKSIQSRMSKELKTPDFALHTSIRDNNLTRLQQLIDALAPVDLHKCLANDDSGWGTTLHVAVVCNDPAAVDVLLDAGV